MIIAEVEVAEVIVDHEWKLMVVMAKVMVVEVIGGDGEGCPRAKLTLARSYPKWCW